MKKLIEFILRNEKLVFILALITVVIGVWSFQNLSFDAVPDITNVQVVVNTKTGALDTEKVELYITKPIEISLSGIPHLHDMRSISKLGLSQVTLVFEDGTDIYWARSQVNERIGLVKSDFPNNLTPELAPISTGLGEIYMYQPVLSAEKKAELKTDREILFFLREVQDKYIRPVLRKVPGVAEVDTNGGFKRELHINIKPNELYKYGLGISDVFEKLKSWGETSSGGFIDQSKNTFSIRGVFTENSIESLNNWTISYNYLGKSIKLSQIADVRFDPSLRMGAATAEGNEIVLGTVLMQTGSNSRQVASDVDAVLKKISLPAGVTLKTLYTRAYLVDQVIHTVFKNLIEGAILVILVLFFFLWNIRAALIVASVLPLTLLMTFIFMKIFNISGNLMSLGALDFGLLVDASVVFVETLLHTMGEPKKKNFLEEIVDIAEHTLPSLLAGVFLLIIVYTPVLFLTGIERKLFSPMALTVIMALMGSILITTIIIPAFMKQFLKVDNITSPAWVEKIKEQYSHLLNGALHRPLTVFFSSLLFLLASLALIMTLGRDFMPSLNEADFVINVSRPTTINLTESIDRQKILEAEILKIPGIENVFSRLGTPDSATDPMGVYLADTFIILKKDDIKNITHNKNNLIDDIIKKIKELEPNAEASSTQPIEMRFNEMLEGSRADVSLKIYNEDLNVLYDLSEEIQKGIEGTPGLASIEKDPLTSLVKTSTLTFKRKDNPPTRFGLSLNAINEMFEIFSLGKSVGSYFYNGTKIPIIMHLDENLKKEFSDVSNFPMSLSGGGTIAFSDLFESESKDMVTTVARSWGKRYASLALEIRNTDIETFVNKTDQLIHEKIKLPPGTTIEWGGQYSNLARAKSRFAVLIPILFLVLFFIIYQTLGSLLNTVILLCAVPFATAGGGIFLYLQGLNLSVSAFIGFITLSGIALLNSIVLINYYQILIRQGMNIETAIREAAVSRFRPVLMTALVAAIGFLPMILNVGLGAEVQKPLATVVIGGIVSSTFGTLFILPVILLLSSRTSLFSRRRIS